MTCAKFPPPKGYKCLDCWQCEDLPGKDWGECSRSMLVGPPKEITTCKAGGLFKEKTKCIEKCGKPPGATCYQCRIKSGQKKGSCISIHPKENGKPLDKCPDWPNLFPTEEKCRAECGGSGPIRPVAKCWQSRGPDCKCELGDAGGPDGPLSTCEEDLGFYTTQGACIKACEGRSKRQDKTIWIIIGVSVAVLVLLIIIGIIIYFAWKKHERQY